MKMTEKHTRRNVIQKGSVLLTGFYVSSNTSVAESTDSDGTQNAEFDHNLTISNNTKKTVECQLVVGVARESKENQFPISLPEIELPGRNDPGNENKNNSVFIGDMNVASQHNEAREYVVEVKGVSDENLKTNVVLTSEGVSPIQRVTCNIHEGRVMIGTVHA
jgi:hypothetical protein